MARKGKTISITKIPKRVLTIMTVLLIIFILLRLRPVAEMVAPIVNMSPDAVQEFGVTWSVVILAALVAYFGLKMLAVFPPAGAILVVLAAAILLWEVYSFYRRSSSIE